MNNEQLIQDIRDLAPWHHNMQLTPEFRIGSAFTEEEVKRENNENVSFIDAGVEFKRKMAKILPDGVENKTFLDCACNAGAYCFWMRDLGAKHAYGFDVREHWINQAKFVQQNRDVGPTDNIDFEVFDMMQLPQRDIEPADITFFKGIFYHLADPIQGLKIATDHTKEILWFNSAVALTGEKQGLICNFERGEKVMSGVHSLSWTPTGPKVITMMLHWLGFSDIWHMFTRPYPNGKYGRMELIACRTPGTLDGIASLKGTRKMATADFKHAVVADEDIKALF